MYFFRRTYTRNLCLLLADQESWCGVEVILRSHEIVNVCVLIFEYRIKKKKSVSNMMITSFAFLIRIINMFCTIVYFDFYLAVAQCRSVCLFAFCLVEGVRLFL